MLNDVVIKIMFHSSVEHQQQRLQEIEKMQEESLKKLREMSAMMISMKRDNF